MTKEYKVEVEDRLNEILKEIAVKENIPIEKVIAQILNRFAISPHILSSKEVEKAYEECGDINLELANL